MLQEFKRLDIQRYKPPEKPEKDKDVIISINTDSDFFGIPSVPTTRKIISKKLFRQEIKKQVIKKQESFRH